MSNKHPVVLNIGLAREGQPNLRFTEVYKALGKAGIVPLEFLTEMSDTEQTVVFEALIPADHSVYAVAEALDQDCIALWDRMGNEGRLVGPRAAKWGDFNPEYFILPNGSRLSNARFC